MKQRSITDQPYEVTLPCIKVTQPIGEFFVASIDSKILRQITFSDVRRMAGEREVDNYLGIQREVDPKRVKEIGRYVKTVDACFPTSVILAVSEECAEFDSEKNTITLRSLHDAEDNPIIDRMSIAKVLDGQHRIEGLKEFEHGTFEINVSIFVDMDIASQAYLFSVVNLAQTKVKKSLVYDLFDYSRARSPQKTAHNIAVALDSLKDSPFEKRIKRLGSATPGRAGETLTQATFVEAVLQYISSDPVQDRDLYQRGKRPAKATPVEAEKLIFRNLFIEEEDMKIADIIFAFFVAVSQKWPAAWNNPDTGYILPKTNGFKSLMRILRPAYLSIEKQASKGMEMTKLFRTLLDKSKLQDGDFVNTKFLPGTGGEARLFNTLQEELFGHSQADKRGKLF